MDPEYADHSPAQQVRHVYRALLDRDMDPHAADKIERLKSGESTLAHVIQEVLGSEEYRARIGSSSRPDRGLFNDHSQYGEVAGLFKVWINEQARHRIVIDVGARGRDRSNSYDLLDSLGWSGVLFEANPNLIGPIRSEFDGLDYRLVQCAISTFDGQATFHLGVNDDVSSLDASATAGWGSIAGAVTVDVRRLGPALQEFGIPHDFDLLSIDIEGEDIAVLNDLIGSSAYRPAWVIIEASYEFKTRSLEDLPFSSDVLRSYRLAGQTAANLILNHIPQ